MPEKFEDYAVSRGYQLRVYSDPDGVIWRVLERVVGGMLLGQCIPETDPEPERWEFIFDLYDKQLGIHA